MPLTTADASFSAAARFVYIFQLPAMNFLRMTHAFLINDFLALLPS